MTTPLDVDRDDDASGAPVRPGLLERLASSTRLPWIAGAVIVAGCALALGTQTSASGSKVFSGFSIGAPNVVTFDAVKFINAQRAAASILAVNPNADLALTMTQVARQAEAVIREEAEGAIVLVKQAVVLTEDIPDITNQVLARFGLPTTVPTISTAPVDDELLELLAPTDNAFSPERHEEDERMRHQNTSDTLQEQINLLDEQRNLIP